MHQKQLHLLKSQIFSKYQSILIKLARTQFINQYYLMKGIYQKKDQNRKLMIEDLLKEPVQKITDRVNFFQRYSPIKLAQKINEEKERQHQKNVKQVNQQQWKSPLFLYQDNSLEQLTELQNSAQLAHMHELWKQTKTTHNIQLRSSNGTQKQKFMQQADITKYFSQQLLHPYKNKLFNTNQQIILPEKEMTQILDYPIKKIIQQHFLGLTRAQVGHLITKIRKLSRADNELKQFPLPKTYQKNIKHNYKQSPDKILTLILAIRHFRFIKKKLFLYKILTQISFVENLNFQYKIQPLIQQYSQYKEIYENILYSIKLPFIGKLINYIQNHMKKSQVNLDFEQFVLNVLRIVLSRPQITTLQKAVKQDGSLNMQVFMKQAKLIGDIVDVFKMLKDTFQTKQNYENKSILRISKFLKQYQQLNRYFKEKFSFLHVVYGFLDKHWNQKIELGIVSLDKDFSDQTSNIKKNNLQIEQYLHQSFRIRSGFQEKSSTIHINSYQICSFIQNIITVHLSYGQYFSISQGFIYDIIIFLQHELKTQNLLKDLQRKQKKTNQPTSKLKINQIFTFSFSQIIFKIILLKNIRIQQIQNQDQQSKPRQKSISQSFVKQLLIKVILKSEKQIIEINHKCKNNNVLDQQERVNQNSKLNAKVQEIIKNTIQMHKVFQRFHTCLKETSIKNEIKQQKHVTLLSYRLLRLTQWLKELLQLFQKDQLQFDVVKQVFNLEVLSKITAKLHMEK